MFVSQMDSLSLLALFMVCMMLMWITFLIYDYQVRTRSPSLLISVGLYMHLIPALALFVTCCVAQHADDTAFVWFMALIVFRYWRTLINTFFWFQYQPARSFGLSKMSPGQCTVVVPTVGPKGNMVYAEMVTAILVNGPTRLIFSTNTDAAARDVENALHSILADIKSGQTVYQIQNNIGPFSPTTDIVVLNAQISSKRQQVVHAFSHVETDILVMVDDTAIWGPQFLLASLPAFDDSQVGIVGTRKWVKRLPRTYDVTLSPLNNLWNVYWSGFWNCIGGLYLVRHNFEIRATNSADGGVFCVSGRSCLIRTAIVNNSSFTDAFLNEYVLRLGDHFPGWGPVNADDDVFITRWVINNGWNVKIQSSKEATMTTTIGHYPENFKFLEQCKRWSRTTFRQNPIALFVDRTAWWKWPLTTWTTLFPWMYNAAFFWDSLAVYTFISTDYYQQSNHRHTFAALLVVFIWASKLVKTIPWFWAHPTDFFLYFLIPAYPMFVYYHSFLKVYTAFTFWDLAWSGRQLPKTQ